jgi:hypothetical protein
LLARSPDHAKPASDLCLADTLLSSQALINESAEFFAGQRATVNTSDIFQDLFLRYLLTNTEDAGVCPVRASTGHIRCAVQIGADCPRTSVQFSSAGFLNLRLNFRSHGLFLFFCQVDKSILMILLGIGQFAQETADTR